MAFGLDSLLQRPVEFSLRPNWTSPQSEWLALFSQQVIEGEKLAGVEVAQSETVLDGSRSSLAVFLQERDQLVAVAL
jgi:hypothetical protein